MSAIGAVLGWLRIGERIASLFERLLEGSRSSTAEPEPGSVPLPYAAVAEQQRQIDSAARPFRPTAIPQAAIPQAAVTTPRPPPLPRPETGPPPPAPALPQQPPSLAQQPQRPGPALKPPPPPRMPRPSRPAVPLRPPPARRPKP